MKKKRTPKIAGATPDRNVEMRERYARQLRVCERFTSVAQYGREFRLRLVVDNQSFEVAGGDTADEAEWMRIMLCVALARLLELSLQDGVSRLLAAEGE